MSDYLEAALGCALLVLAVLAIVLLGLAIAAIWALVR